jgi:magnesium transporter
MTLAAEELAAVSVQQNDDIRKITGWVAIAVIGYFGQNVPYPGFGETSGFLASVLIMLAIAVSLYIVFKRKKWL